MRDILFRGKRVDNGDWVEGYFVKYATGKHSIHYPDEAGIQFSVPVIPETVGQMLVEYGDVRYFEGDIVRDGKYICVVAFYYGCIRLDALNHRKASESVNIYHSFDITHDLQIIGNIHDNADLAKAARSLVGLSVAEIKEWLESYNPVCK